MGLFSKSRSEEDALPHETAAMHAIKRGLLEQVREQAGTGRPELEQYRLACEAFAKTDLGQKMVAEGHWSARIAADLHGQDLHGYKLSEPKKAKTYDLHDRDGNGQVDVEATSPFYDHIRLNNANLENTFVEPASSFSEQIAKGKNLKHMTFNKLEAGDGFTFAHGHYEGITLSHFNGGEMVFAKNSHVDGLTLDGKQAAIRVEAGAHINHMSVSEGFRIVTLDMAPGSVIKNSDLRDATVSMASHVRGSHWHDVKLSGNIEGLDLSGAHLRNLTVNNAPVTSVEQLRGLGVSVDAHTTVSTSHEFLREAQQQRVSTLAAQAGAVLNSAMNSLHAPKPSVSGPTGFNYAALQESLRVGFAVAEAAPGDVGNFGKQDLSQVAAAMPKKEAAALGSFTTAPKSSPGKPA